MRYKLLTRLNSISIISLTIMMQPANAGGMFDWMSPNKWFNNNNRDYDRDYYRGYGYGYPGYVYPGWGGYGYPGWGGYPGYVYPNLAYPGYTYPVQPQQNNSNTQSTPPTPQ